MESLENTTPHITSVDIDEKVYRADPAFSASDLKYAKDHGLQAFHTYKYGKDNPPRIATPAIASMIPIPSRVVIFSSRKNMASIAVNSGLNVIIRDASPAAVLSIPSMKNTW